MYVLIFELPFRRYNASGLVATQSKINRIGISYWDIKTLCGSTIANYQLLPVPTRILLLPVPKVPAHRLQILRRLEPKFRLR